MLIKHYKKPCLQSQVKAVENIGELGGVFGREIFHTLPSSDVITIDEVGKSNESEVTIEAS